MDLSRTKERIHSVRDSIKETEKNWGGFHVDVNSPNKYLNTMRPPDFKVSPERGEHPEYTLFCITNGHDANFGIKVGVHNNTLFTLRENGKQIGIPHSLMVAHKPASQIGPAKSIALSKEKGIHTQTQRYAKENEDIYVIEVEGSDYKITIESPVNKVIMWNRYKDTAVNLDVIYETVYKNMYGEYPVKKCP